MARSAPAAGDDGDPPGALARAREHVDRDLRAEERPQARPPARPGSGRSRRRPPRPPECPSAIGKYSSSPVEPDAVGDEARRRDDRVLVQRSMHVVEAAPLLEQALVRLAREGLEPLDVVLEGDGMLREEERRGARGTRRSRRSGRRTSPPARPRRPRGRRGRSSGPRTPARRTRASRGRGRGTRRFRPSRRRARRERGSTRREPRRRRRASPELPERPAQRLARRRARPANRSPSRATRPSTTSMVNRPGSRPSVTSSQRSGVETGAPGRGRTE